MAESPREQSAHPSLSSAAQEHATGSTQLRRRRIAKACDECRKRKTRCNGRQPCLSCSESSRQCTYSRVQLRRMADWHYIEILENRLQRAQNHLKDLLDKSSDEPPIDVGDVLEPPQEIRPKRPDPGGSPDSVSQDYYLENMIESEDRAGDNGYEDLDYHGRSSGFAFLHATKKFFEVDICADSASSDPRKSSNGKRILELFDSPLPGKQALKLDGPVSHLLPSHDVAKEMTRDLFTNGCVLLRFIHQPTFERNMARIYLHGPLDFSDEDHQFLPLLYAVLGLGFIFSQDQHKVYGCERVVWQGMRHFVAAQKMLDIHKCRDLFSLQTIICMIIFLQSAARISTCYSYIGAAVTAAVKLGLHREARNGNDPVEQEIRKRVFWVILKTDTYIGAILGLPTLLNLEDVDQEMPLQLDDESVTSQGIHSPIGNSTFSIQAASNAHTRLQMILGKAVKLLYPIKGPHSQPGRDNTTHIISYAKIREVEEEMRQWQQGLPYTREVIDKSPAYISSIILQLRMAYAHVQIVLYRPFLHYLTQMNKGEELDERKSRCALACVKTSQDTMAIARDMEMQGLVCAASWPSVYTIFLATVSLIFFAATTSLGGPEMLTIREDADNGMILLDNLKCHDLGPRRCLAVLEIFRHFISSKLSREKTHQCSQQEASTAGSIPSGNPHSASTASNLQHVEFNNPAWSNMNGAGREPNGPVALPNNASIPPSLSTHHPDSSIATGAGLITQLGGSQTPSTYGPYTEPSSVPDHTQNSLGIAGGMHTDFDDMSIPYMDSYLYTDEGLLSQQQENQQSQQGSENRDDVPTLLSPEDFASVNEFAALMNTYPLNLTQPFNYSAPEER